jgi:hypothetical protein
MFRLVCTSAVFWLFSISTFAATIHHNDYLRCERLLASSRPYRNRSAKLFATGMDSAANAYAYVGLSSKEMFQIAKGGLVKSPEDFRVFIIRHATADRAEKLFSEALIEASLRTAADLIQARLAAVANKAKIDRDRLKNFLNALRERNPRVKILSPGIDDVISLRARAIFSPSINSQIQLTELFSQIPLQGGVVLAVNESIMTGALGESNGIAVVRKVGLGNIVGIEPNSDLDFEFLNQLEVR